MAGMELPPIVVKPDQHERNRARFGALTVGTLYGGAFALAILDVASRSGLRMSEPIRLALFSLLLGMLIGLGVDLAGKWTPGKTWRALWVLVIGALFYLVALSPALQMARE